MAEPVREPEQPELGLDTPTKPKRKSKLSHEYSDLFLAAREMYPKRDGANPWDDAWRQWKTRIKQGDTELDMLAGVQRYARWCSTKGKTGTEFVMQAARFFGRGRYFAESWAVESKPTTGLFPDRADPTVPRFTTPHERRK